MVIIDPESILRVDAALFFQLFCIHHNVHGNRRKNSNNLPHHQKVLCESIISFFKQKNPMSVNICSTILEKVRKEG